MKEEMP